jgi:hypothetical protein
MNHNPTPRTVEGLTKVPLPTAPGLIRAERSEWLGSGNVAVERGNEAEINGKLARKRSVLLQTELVARANTAVDYARAAGVYYSLSEMINVALERELVRLAQQINDGEMFASAPRSARGRQRKQVDH